jgi:hypothetical protein
MLSTFDVSFDHTFARAVTTAPIVLPPVGGDGGGGVPGTVLPFSTNPNLLASCLRPTGQAWERWSGVPLSKADYLMPFIVAVPKPDDIATSPFCPAVVTIVDAMTGAEVLKLTPNLTYLTQKNTLYIIHKGTNIAALPFGLFRVLVGTMPDAAISDPFEVRCFDCANTYLIRLKNDNRIGDLFYDRDWEQSFYVEGELIGPTYEADDINTERVKTGSTNRKIWTLALEEQSEPIADALALASMHRLVEVSLIRSDGTVKRSIQALANQAKVKTSVTEGGLSDIDLTLPVSVIESSLSGSDAGCITDAAGNEVVEIFCADPDDL